MDLRFRLRSPDRLICIVGDMPQREFVDLACRGRDFMKDKSPNKDQPEGLPEELPGGASQALSAALQKTFEALLQEPVPDKFEALIARIREEETQKNANPDDEES
ncbi:NepR family anti-sigma factor [Hyphomonas adhaerens]|nr:hypothetical protein [Hyphomonas adhaerens]|tara:strand:- start:123 stop:437 length:315 start_codon:yes stop_codon:yes gene_type:complete